MVFVVLYVQNIPITLCLDNGFMEVPPFVCEHPLEHPMETSLTRSATHPPKAKPAVSLSLDGHFVFGLDPNMYAYHMVYTNVKVAR